MEREVRNEFRGEADGPSSDASVKQEHGSGVVDGVVPASAMQQILPLQFLHASTASSGSTAASLSWMTPYQMMMLPGTQQLILPGTGSGGVFAMHDGQLYVSPIADNAGAAEHSGSNELLHAQHYPAGVPLSGGANTESAGPSAAIAHQQQHSSQTTPRRGSAVDGSKPPKKPLTPYMIFSKRIWPQVKAENAHLSSVCELGAIVGGLWRDLDPTQKQEFNELYAKDKVRYDEELRSYLKQTGLLASDLAKMRTKRPPPPHHRPPLMHAGAPSAAAHSAAAWSNGRASPQRSSTQQPPAAALPTLFANHDGSVVVGGGAGHTYGDDRSGSARSWQWPQSGDGGMVMYQMLPGGDRSVESQNGLSLSSSPEYGAGGKSASARVDQLEAEVQRLQGALAEKTLEAQKLQHELQAAVQLIEGHQQQLQQQQLSQQQQQQLPRQDNSEAATAEGETSVKNELPRAPVPTTAGSPD